MPRLQLAECHGPPANSYDFLTFPGHGGAPQAQPRQRRFRPVSGSIARKPCRDRSNGRHAAASARRRSAIRKPSVARASISLASASATDGGARRVPRDQWPTAPRVHRQPNSWPMPRHAPGYRCLSQGSNQTQALPTVAHFAGFRVASYLRRVRQFWRAPSRVSVAISRCSDMTDADRSMRAISTRYHRPTRSIIGHTEGAEGGARPPRGPGPRGLPPRTASGPVTWDCGAHSPLHPPGKKPSSFRSITDRAKRPLLGEPA